MITSTVININNNCFGRFVLAATAGLALSVGLQSAPAEAASFTWTFAGDGSGSGSLMFEDSEVSTNFLNSNGTGIFSASDLGASAAFSYFLNSFAFEPDQWSAGSLAGVINPQFNFNGGVLVSFSWEDFGDIYGDFIPIHNNETWGPGSFFGETGTYSIETLEAWQKPDSQPVPEPASLLGLLAVGTLGATIKRNKKEQE